VTAQTTPTALRINPGEPIAPEAGESLDLVGSYSLHGVAELHEATGLGLPVSGDAHNAATARRLLAAEIRNTRPGLQPYLAEQLQDAYAYLLGTDPRTITDKDLNND